VSAAGTLARAEAAGVRFRIGPGGRVRMQARTPPPADLLADLRRWRDDVAHLVALRDRLAADQRVAAVVAPAATPPPAVDWWHLPYGEERGRAFASARKAKGACPTCAGKRWWSGEGEQAGPRCMSCHPPPPGLRVVSDAAPDDAGG
jgi:hypothetical protein